MTCIVKFGDSTSDEWSIRNSLFALLVDTAKNEPSGEEVIAILESSELHGFLNLPRLERADKASAVVVVTLLRSSAARFLNCEFSDEDVASEYAEYGVDWPTLREKFEASLLELIQSCDSWISERN